MGFAAVTANFYFLLFFLKNPMSLARVDADLWIKEERNRCAFSVVLVGAKREVVSHGNLY
jgi:hypothetical protein